MAMEYLCVDLGLSDYKTAYFFQKKCVADVKSKTAEGYLIFTEHRPVFTIGRTAQKDNLLVGRDVLKSIDIDVREADRGGDITFHGPGQLVVYPIIDLKKYHKDVHKFLHQLEEAAIRALADFMIPASRVNGRTGVWVKEDKIASVGVGVSNWVSYHGLSINGNVDLGFFDMINPCGFKNIRITSIKEILNKEIDLSFLKNIFIEHFCDIFMCNIKR